MSHSLAWTDEEVEDVDLDSILKPGPTDPTNPIWGPLNGTPIAAYVRISDLRGKRGTRLERRGVIRQLKRILRKCHERNCRVVYVYEDNSLSAWKKNVIRPDFELLVEALRARQVRGVAVAEIARFMRRNRDLERVLDFYEDDPSLVFVCLKEELNLGTPGGRLMARVFVSMAEEASAASSSRVIAWHADKAERGESSGGAYRAFGWGVEVEDADGVKSWDRTRHNGSEARAIREAVEALLEKRTNYGSIAADWTRQGLLTPRGNAWSGKAVRAVMQSGRLAGFRVFQGKIAVNEDTGERVMATDYMGIIDVPTWEALQLALQKLAGPQSGLWHGGGRGAGTKATAKYLLSGGLAICGECWKALSGTAVKATGRHSYLCTGVGGCGTVGIAGDSLDALAAQLFEEWASVERVDAGLPEWPRALELSDLRSELAYTQAEFKARRIAAREAVQIIGPLSMEVEALEAEERTYAAQSALVQRASGDLLAVWGASDVHGRRALLPRATAGIVVRKSTPGFRAKRGQVDVRRLEILPPLRPAAEARAG